MLENKSARVYCFCAVRSYHRSSRSAPKTRSREARTITEMGLFSTNRSNTSPSIAASLMAKLKKAYRTQYRPTFTPLVQYPHFTTCVRGVCHGITPLFLPAHGPGAPLALRHAALCLAKRVDRRGSEAIQTSATAGQAFQRPQAVSWPHPQ